VDPARLLAALLSRAGAVPAPDLLTVVLGPAARTPALFAA
jgi:hypothetical protein